MFISIILNTEYMDIASRSKWYLKNLLHCKENGWILITHEYMRTHWQQLQEEITPSLFTSWEMQPFAAEDVRDVEQYFIPDKLLDDIENLCGSRSEALFRLTTSLDSSLVKHFQDILTQIQKKHPNEKIEGVLHTLEAWESIRFVCEQNTIPLIPYSFSAIRKPHGYRQTLYYANQNGILTTTEETKERYSRFLGEDSNDIPIFSHRELIAIFGKERTLPLIPLINAEPQYELGICTECFSINPYFFVHNKLSDDDIRYECEKLYDKSQITVRNHSLQVDNMQLDRSVVHNDPAAWILSCRRLAAARSQIALKIMLWNRTAIVKADTLEFSFMCEKDYTSTNKVDINKLNYFLFAYLIPNDLMFSTSYWQWLMTNPAEKEIYNYHLNFYVKKLNLPQSIFTEKNEYIRFQSILQSRGTDAELVHILMKNTLDFIFDYNTATSRVVINKKSYWRLNKIEDNVRHFHIELDEQVDNIDFYPLDDVAGCASIVSVQVNGKDVAFPHEYQEMHYLSKVIGKYKLKIPNASPMKLDICWKYMSNIDFLHQTSIK